MELITASRIVKMQQTVHVAMPYADVLVRVISALTTHSRVLEHPLLRDAEPPRWSAVLVIAGDQGLADTHSTNVIRVAEQLQAKLLEERQEYLVYVTGNKGVSYYDFRYHPVGQSWTRFSIVLRCAHTREISDILIERLPLPCEEGGVDQLHVTAAHFMIMLTQETVTLGLLPLVAKESSEPTDEGDAVLPYYAFKPTPEVVLDQVLPMYVINRICSILLQSGTSELANKQHAMKSATDNIQQLIEYLIHEVDQVHRAETTQEISEIASGAAALIESAGNG